MGRKRSGGATKNAQKAQVSTAPAEDKEFLSARPNNCTISRPVDGGTKPSSPSLPKTKNSQKAPSSCAPTKPSEGPVSPPSTSMSQSRPQSPPPAAGKIITPSPPRNITHLQSSMVQSSLPAQRRTPGMRSAKDSVFLSQHETPHSAMGRSENGTTQSPLPALSKAGQKMARPSAPPPELVDMQCEITPPRPAPPLGRPMGVFATEGPSVGDDPSFRPSNTRRPPSLSHSETPSSLDHTRADTTSSCACLSKAHGEQGDTFPAVTPPTLSEGSTRAHAILQTSVPSHLRGPDVLEMHPVFSDADATPAWADVPPPSENASPSSSYSDDYKPPSPTADRDGILFYSRAGITQRIAPPQITHTQSDTTLQVKLQSSVPNELRRATSLERLKVLEPLETLHTDLVEHLKIPWSEDFRPGYGVNALTGEFTARSAFKDFKMVESSKLGESHTTVEHLKWQTVKELRDDFEISVGATVNVLCPQVGANAKIATLLSKNTSTSTILVEYRVDANFAVDYIPNVELQEGLDRLSDEEFRAKYGDYYIAGCQKGYSCRMIAECKINEGKVTEGLQREAEAFVKECFTGKLKFDNSESTTKRFSLLSVIVDTEGCLADISNMSSVAVADVPQTLSQLELRKNTPGVPRVAYLYHYSALRSCMLSRRMQVPWAMFDRARVLRGVYAHLRACRLHPALEEYHSDRRAIEEVLKHFENQRKYLVRAHDDRNRKVGNIDVLQRDLFTWRHKIDMLIQRYDLICTVVDMDKSIVPGLPSLAHDLRYYRWDCGKTGGTKSEQTPEPKEINVTKKDQGSDSRPYVAVSFGPSCDAFEFEWVSSVTHNSLRIRGSSREKLEFSTRNEALPPPPTLKGTGSKFHRKRQQTTGMGTFDHCLSNHEPVYILGWSLSCYWPRNASKPSIEVDHPSKYILSNRLSISVDNSRSTQWHCKVTFVPQSLYNFPHLLLRRGGL